MPFKPGSQKFTAKIGALQIGTENPITLGGENVLPFYVFDGGDTATPKVGIQISDEGVYKVPGIEAFFAGASAIADVAKKAQVAPGVDFVALSFDGAHPDKGDRSVEDAAEIAKQVAGAISKPLVIIGSKNTEKDAKLFDKLAAALEGKNVLFLSAKEENYKTVAASAGLAYNQKVGAESSVDINLAKQLNVLITQMGLGIDKLAMNLGSAAAGYGFEYVATTIDRVKSAALAQNDDKLQAPIVTPVGDEAWSVKEAVVSIEDFPDWDTAEERGIHMEIATAAAVLAAGSNAVILHHPQSVATVSALVAALV
jgi:acetyl-CoA decarbonylase/synthase complex subunit delta